MKFLGACMLAASLALCACTEDRTPQQALLDRAAAALENKNSAEFLQCIDLGAYAANQVKSMASKDVVLDALDKWGNQLGVGGLDSLLGKALDVEGKIRQELNEGAASGQLMAQCGQAITPDCPWVPSALKNAAIIDLGPDAAIAKVTTPANITSWLALGKIGDAWKIVGRAPMEEQARRFAAPAPQDAGNS